MIHDHDYSYAHSHARAKTTMKSLFFGVDFKVECFTTNGIFYFYGSTAANWPIGHGWHWTAPMRDRIMVATALSRPIRSHLNLGIHSHIFFLFLGFGPFLVLLQFTHSHSVYMCLDIPSVRHAHRVWSAPDIMDAGQRWKRTHNNIKVIIIRKQYGILLFD